MKNLTFRITKKSDGPYLKQWLLEPGVIKWFPMVNEREIDDSVRIWLTYDKGGSAITVECQGEPAGMAVLYINPFEKLKHQCLFAIIVGGKFRGKGIGTQLLDYIFALAKDKYGIQLIHLEVYEQNPAISLYKRSGFVEYGRHERFLKENPKTYRAKILMQKRLEGF